MKSLFFLILFFGCAALVQAQDVTANANALAGKIAGKMKDSLSLSVDQAARVKAINLKLHEEKMAMRRQHSGATDLSKYLQQVENSRDSLYKAILSEPQFQLYRQKKRTLVNAH